MNLLIAGSRDHRPEPNYIKSVTQPFNTPTLLLNGGAIGVDEAARVWARSVGIPIDQHLPDYVTHGKRAPLIRNEEMVKLADYVIAIWNGKTTGTKNVIDNCHRHKKPYAVFFV